MKKDKGEFAFLILYVDDGAIFGTPEVVKAVLKDLGTEFKIKHLGPIKNFVGCHVIENPQTNTIWIHQPKLLRDLKKKFGPMIKPSNKIIHTPAAPHTTIMRPQKGDPLITPEQQTDYRSGVGMLLYLVKHSRPDLSNAVRELSKVADGATEAHWKSLMRTIQYVFQTPNFGLRIQPKHHKRLFYLEGLSDSEYAGDKDTRISVYGYQLYFCGAPIAWKSKSGKSVTLSSTEAEYFAISEIAKEAIFAKNVIESMGIKMEFPIVINVDNTGAIYIANNYTVGQRTKHIDVRVHFVREFIEDGIIKVVFVRSEDNDSDIYTKNVTTQLYVKHRDKNMEDIDEKWIKDD